MNRTCSDRARVVSVGARWVFAHLLNHYFGEATLVFPGEAEGGGDLEVAITEEWLVENHVTNLDISRDDAIAAAMHVKECSTAECKAAVERLLQLQPFFAEGKIPGGDALALVSVFGSRSHHDRKVFERVRGFGDAIDEIKPFLLWLKEAA